MRLSFELPTKSVWGFLAIVFIFRLAYIYIVPIQLVPDEAYYWDWSRHLDIGYYSKPPMIAWLNYLSTHLFGINEFGVRFFAATLGTASAGIVYMLAKEMFDERVAMISFLFSLLTPANAALSFVMTIDPPLIFFGTLFLLLFWKGLNLKGNGQILFFTLAGISFGLAFLSKQMMIVYFISIAIFLIYEKEYRSNISVPAIFLFLFFSIALISLPMYWNYKHNWVTFQETVHHISSNPSILKTISTFFEYVGGQVLIITPIFAVIIYFSIYNGILNFKKLDTKSRFLFFFGPIYLVIFLFLSLKQRVNANWPALFYPPAIIFSVAWFLKNIKEKYITKWINRGLVVAYVFVFLTYITPFIFTIETISGTKIDPTKRGKGWKNLAIQLSDIYKQQGKDIFILGEKRDIISEMAFYMDEHPVIYKIDRTPNIVKDQYEVWGTHGINMTGKDCLILRKGSRTGKELIKMFDKVIKIAEIKSKIGKNSYRIYSVFKGTNYKGSY